MTRYLLLIFDAEMANQKNTEYSDLTRRRCIGDVLTWNVPHETGKSGCRNTVSKKYVGMEHCEVDESELPNSNIIGKNVEWPKTRDMRCAIQVRVTQT